MYCSNYICNVCWIKIWEILKRIFRLYDWCRYCRIVCYNNGSRYGNVRNEVIFSYLFNIFIKSIWLSCLWYMLLKFKCFYWNRLFGISRSRWWNVLRCIWYFIFMLFVEYGVYDVERWKWRVIFSLYGDVIWRWINCIVLCVW